MKVSTTKITVEIGLDEWSKIFEEWQQVALGEKIKAGYNTTPNLYSFLSHIHTVAQNPSHTIEEKL